MAAVFSMQGFGQMTGALVALFLTLGFKESLLTAKSAAVCTGVCSIAVDKMWRVLIGKLLLLAYLSAMKLIVFVRLRCRACMHRSLLPSHHPRNSQIYF
jgi:hypothetical protein